MTTLYRKYRPQLFADIHDQEHIVRTLTNEIAHGQIAHAYLFTGPRGVGKTTIARLLAKALNCQKRKTGEFEPCDKCSSCTEIASGRNIDVIEIDAASHTGVDNVRENIIENAQFKPTLSPYKIFVIDEVHMLSTSAFNALLKTIEEPPAHVVFILATTELQKLPATIISRCQRFAFKKITRESMLKKLEGICKSEKVKVEKSVLEKIIDKSEGGMRDAESLLGQILALSLKEIHEADVEAILPSSDFSAVLNFLSAISNYDTADAITQINTLADSGTNLDQFSLNLIDILRAVLIAQSGYDVTSIINTNKENLKTIKELSTKHSALQIIAMIDSAVQRKRELKQMPIPQLPLELFAVQFSSLSFRPSARFASINSTSGEIPQTSHTVQDNNKNTTFKEEKKTPDINKSEKEEPKPLKFTETIKTVINEITHKNQQPQASLEQIKSKWDEVVGNISKNNASLTFVLKSAVLKEVNFNGLNLSFQFKIHLEKMEEIKNRKILEDELEKALGERIKISCILESAQSENNIELNNLAAEFGGQVI